MYLGHYIVSVSINESHPRVLFQSQSFTIDPVISNTETFNSKSNVAGFQSKQQRRL